MSAGTIRPVTPDDAAAVAAVYAPYVTDSVVSFELDPPDETEMRHRIASVTARYPWLLMTDDDGVAGYVYAGPHHARAAYDWSVDVTVYLDRRAHRKGYARRLYTALFDLLRAQGFVTAYAGVSLPNEASVGLHEAMGFTPIGVFRAAGYKQDRWWDVGYWQLALTEKPHHPADPVPWPALADDVVHRALQC